MLTTHELVNVLTARVNSIEKQLRDCQRENMALAGQMKNMMNMKPQKPDMKIPEDMVGKQSMRPMDVQAKWAMWRLMHENGMNKNQIAMKFGVDHSTVEYARQMNWNAKEGVGK